MEEQSNKKHNKLTRRYLLPNKCAWGEKDLSYWMVLLLGYIRCSVQVKLVAGLDVEHEIPSIQILHHEEQVLLDTKMQRGEGCSFAEEG